jgi:hypothetical protein
MSKPLRVRRLTDHEGRQIQQIVRRGGGRSEKSIVRWRRALVVQASAGGNTVPVIARFGLALQMSGSASATSLGGRGAVVPGEWRIFAGAVIDCAPTHRRRP